MSPRREHPGRRRLVGAAVLTACLLLAASAVAFIDVYRNAFRSQSEYRELDPTSGAGKCGRKHNAKPERMRITVKQGPQTCSFKLPVQGDGSHPDHRLTARARTHQDTPGSVREEAYVAVQVRVGGGGRYELRVFPRIREWELRRKPDGAAFPVGGHDNDVIRGFKRFQKLRLRAVGDRVVAEINGVQVANVIDPTPGALEGSKLIIGAGSTADTQKNTVAQFDKLQVAVPSP